MAFISSARASCAISGIDLLAAGPYSSVPPSLSPPLVSLYLLSSSSLRLYPSIFLPRSLARSVSRRFFFFFFFSGQADRLNVKSWLMRHDNLTQRTVQALLHLVSI